MHVRGEVNLVIIEEIFFQSIQEDVHASRSVRVWRRRNSHGNKLTIPFHGKILEVQLEAKLGKDVTTNDHVIATRGTEDIAGSIGNGSIAKELREC